MRPVVLFVEDEAITHAVGVAALVRAGFSVLGAASAEQALDAFLAETGPVCAIVVAVHLDGQTDGFELARRARVLRPDLAVLVISARPYPDAAARLPSGGRFLHKPVEPNALVGALRALLGAPALCAVAGSGGGIAVRRV